MVVQWLKILLPMQGTQVQSLVWEDRHAAEQLSSCATTTEPVCHNTEARVTQLLKPACLEAVLRNEE